MDMQIFHQKELALLGFGLEGQSTLKFLLKQIDQKVFLPKKITIYDQKQVDLSIYLSSVKGFELSAYADEDYLEKAFEKDYVFKSPGVSLKNFIQSDLNDSKLHQKVYCQTEMFLNCFRDSSLAVTGSKGKSTTTTLAYLLQKEAKLLGNIGVPCLEAYEDFEQNSMLHAVIELSSHQLEFMKTSPKVALLLNFYEEHLDHYRSLEHYYQAKLNIFKHQKGTDFALFSLDNLDLYQHLKILYQKNKFLAQKIGFTSDPSMVEKFLVSPTDWLQDLSLLVLVERKVEAGEHEVELTLFSKNQSKKIIFKDLPFSLSGKHHALDLSMAFLGSFLLENPHVQALFGTSSVFQDFIQKAEMQFKQFKALEHRLEYCGSMLNREWFNDSISTIPESTVLALDTLGQVDVLILGGKDRGVNYRPLQDVLLQQKVPVVIGLPDTAKRILEECPLLAEKIKFFLVQNMEEAVKLAVQESREGMKILLSPAASSYNVYKSFEERGRHFKACIQSLKK